MLTFYDKAILIENYSFSFKKMYESSIDVFKVQIHVLLFIYLLFIYYYIYIFISYLFINNEDLLPNFYESSTKIQIVFAVFSILFLI